MGLFDSLKKNLSNLADEVVSHKDDLQKELQRFQTQQSTGAGMAYSDSVSEVTPRYTTQRKYPEGYDQSRRIEEIILRNFPDYELRRNVSVSTLSQDAHPACEPISFLLCRDSQPCVAVVLSNVSRHSGMPLKGTDNVCRMKGIPYMHLYNEYENAEGYIVDKINALLN